MTAPKKRLKFDCGILTAGNSSHKDVRKMASRLVLLDTNALLMPFQFRLNLETELQRLMGTADIAIPTPVITELELLAKRNRDAQAALRLASRYRVIDVPGSADDALLDLGVTLRAVVVTNDQPLLDRLKAASVPRVFLRSRNHLVGEGI
jgi:rRNA-processing protein FCF1